MIEWAGVSSDELGIVIEHYPKPIIPERKQSVQSIDGRSGDILISTNAFKNYNQPYEVFLDSKNKGGLQAVFPRLVDWLLGNEGYQRLEDSYFPDYYRLAYYSGGADFLTMFNEYGRGTLTFNCNPCKYFKSGEKEVAITSGMKLYNPSAFAAAPLIRFNTPQTPVTNTNGVYVHPENTYAAIQINDRPNVVINIGGMARGTEIMIDVENHRVYKIAPGSTPVPNPHSIIESDAEPTFVHENKWYDFNISNGYEDETWDDNTVLPQTNPPVHIAQGHLQQTVYDITPSENVDYELVDGHLILKIHSLNSSAYGKYEDLMLAKGESQFSYLNLTNLRVTPRWWTI